MFGGESIPTYLAAADCGGQSVVAIKDLCRFGERALSQCKGRGLPFNGGTIFQNARKILDGRLVGVHANTSP
jgi:hypothetical protein